MRFDLMAKVKYSLCRRHAGQNTVFCVVKMRPHSVWFYLAVFIRCFLVLYRCFWIYHIIGCYAVLHIFQSFCKFFKNLFDRQHYKCYFIPVSNLFHRQNSVIFVQSCIRNILSLCYQAIYMTLLSLQFNTLFDYLTILARASIQFSSFYFYVKLITDSSLLMFSGAISLFLNPETLSLSLYTDSNILKIIWCVIINS